jgi:heme O synthase-like polyprenyltransferase
VHGARQESTRAATAIFMGSAAATATAADDQKFDHALARNVKRSAVREDVRSP